MDATDSGLSIDKIIDVKEQLFKISGGNSRLLVTEMKARLYGD